MTSKEKEKERARRYRAKHPERVRALRHEVMKRWRLANPERYREICRRAWLKRKADPVKLARLKEITKRAGRKHLCKKHGWSVELYEATFAYQRGRCAICDRTWRKNLAIDHNHRCCPGAFSCGDCIRGLLCDMCNHGLGCFREDIETMKKAIAYLERTAETS